MISKNVFCFLLSFYFEKKFLSVLICYDVDLSYKHLHLYMKKNIGFGSSKEYQYFFKLPEKLLC